MLDWKEEELWTVRETAKFLKVSVSTVYNLLNRGELHYVKVGQRRRILRQEIYNYLATQTDTLRNAAAVVPTPAKATSPESPVAPAPSLSVSGPPSDLHASPAQGLEEFKGNAQSVASGLVFADRQ